MRRFGSGVGRSGSTTLAGCDAAGAAWATRGIWTSSSPSSTGGSSICGGPWTRTATSSTSSSKRGAIGGRPSDSSGKLLKGQGCVPRRLITDKLRSYPAACRTVMPSVVHCTDQYTNNRAEVSHQPTRQRERQMRRFKSAAHVQRFLSVHGPVQNLFRVGRHLLRAVHHRLLRTQAFGVWREVTCA